MAMVNVIPASAVARRIPRETISHIATDSEALQTGAPGRLTRLFRSQNDAVTGLPKTKYQSNMKTPGMFQRPETMDVMRIGIGVWPAHDVAQTTGPTSAMSLLLSFLEDSNLIFTVGGSRKEYWNGPIHRLPGGFGLSAFLDNDSSAAASFDSVASNGSPLARAMCPLKYTIRLQWGEPFDMTLEIGHNLPASFAGLGANPRVFALLEGQKHRGIQ